MRKSQITIRIICDLTQEKDVLTEIINFSKDLKTKGKIEKANLRTEEIEVPVELEI